MKKLLSIIAAALLSLAVAGVVSAQGPSSPNNPSIGNTPSAAPVSSPSSLPLISNISVKHNIVYLNARPEPDTPLFFVVPKGKVFTLTDMVVQNRAPGDTPVGATDFTRFTITSPSGADTFFTVVGNDTLDVHFETGVEISDLFRFYNVINSTAPFVEFVITGTLH